MKNWTQAKKKKTNRQNGQWPPKDEDRHQRDTNNTEKQNQCTHRSNKLTHMTSLDLLVKLLFVL